MLGSETAMNRTACVVNISGPYGAGKDSLIAAVIGHLGGRGYRLRTLTTRHNTGSADPSYLFCDDEAYSRLLGTGRWISNQQLDSGLLYGTSLDEIESVSDAGLVGVSTIYANALGAGELRTRLGFQVLSIGVRATASDMESEIVELDRRARSRGRETNDQLIARRAWQASILEYLALNPVVETPDGAMTVFDKIVVNESLPAAIAETLRAVDERCPQLPATLATDADLDDHRRHAFDVGGSYFEEPDNALALGTVIAWSDELSARFAVLPRQADPSFYSSSLCRHLMNSCPPDHWVFGLYQRADKRLICPMITEAERIRDFTQQEDQGTLELIAYVALSDRDVRKRLSS